MTLEQCMRCKFVRINGWKYDKPKGYFDVWVGCEFYLEKFTDATGFLCSVPRSKCKTFEQTTDATVEE